MSYKVAFTPSFRYSLKKLEKRFPHVKDDVREAIEELLSRPRMAPVIPGGGGARKHRVRNSDLPKGKRSGYRLIYLVVEQPEPVIALMLLYFKPDKEGVGSRELRQLLLEVSNLLDPGATP